MRTWDKVFLSFYGVIVVFLIFCAACGKKKIEPEIVVPPRYELPDFGNWEFEMDGLPEDTGVEELEE